MLFDLPHDVREIIWSKLHELKIEEGAHQNEVKEHSNITQNNDMRPDVHAWMLAACFSRLIIVIVKILPKSTGRQVHRVFATCIREH